LLATEKVANEWTTQNGVNGTKFTDIATGKTLFLPVTGNRNFSDGTLYGAGSYGFYWSSTAYEEPYAYFLRFSSDDAGWLSRPRSYGIGVRCVAE